ncbi:hypothetical protein IE81DRAFT_349072 [Ceraceosorus guamensis]|uniref:Uncharacterized protein n=1 Tax=Ceraceosorus guamensis TaxID=1522189 RepID=A0A316VVY3_9BASI|nr:hypothetical protein IE81DRAFT_349072 [Ceraceosorus guamensis]PWN40593.1 hypothetical protein IE81DRAFT_349072 [Ceraceosorus guamensis]
MSSIRPRRFGAGTYTQPFHFAETQMYAVSSESDSDLPLTCGRSARRQSAEDTSRRVKQRLNSMPTLGDEAVKAIKDCIALGKRTQERQIRETTEQKHAKRLEKVEERMSALLALDSEAEDWECWACSSAVPHSYPTRNADNSAGRFRTKRLLSLKQHQASAHAKMDWICTRCGKHWPSFTQAAAHVNVTINAYHCVWLDLEPQVKGYN